MPTLLDLWGACPLTELAAQVGIPFRRLGEYATGARPYTPADRATLAAFFGIDPARLEPAGASDPAPAAAHARSRRRPATPPRPLAPAARAPRPPGVPPPTAIVTAQGMVEARVSGMLQRPPQPDAGPAAAQGPPRFWILELLIPHQPLRGQPSYPPLAVRCAVHRRQFDPYRWLQQGDRVVITGTPMPRSGQLYVSADTLSTPRAERLKQLLAAHQAGEQAADEALEALLGPGWSLPADHTPGIGVQTARPAWSPPPGPVEGPQGRVQITLQGQLQTDPTMELDAEGGGLAELRLEIAPPEQDMRLPVVRYRVQMRPRALRAYPWLQRGDRVTIGGDLVRLGTELLVEATTIELASDN